MAGLMPGDDGRWGSGRAGGGEEAVAATVARAWQPGEVAGGAAGRECGSRVLAGGGWAWAMAGRPLPGGRRGWRWQAGIRRAGEGSCPPEGGSGAGQARGGGGTAELVAIASAAMAREHGATATVATARSSWRQWQRRLVVGDSTVASQRQWRLPAAVAMGHSRRRQRRRARGDGRGSGRTTVMGCGWPAASWPSAAATVVVVWEVAWWPRTASRGHGRRLHLASATAYGGGVEDRLGAERCSRWQRRPSRRKRLRPAWHERSGRWREAGLARLVEEAGLAREARLVVEKATLVRGGAAGWCGTVFGAQRLAGKGGRRCRVPHVGRG
ncbi:Os07g0440300 [Oryza sativa Japonica Group]|uniref:Os07g0440300 protein n=1 Tax=Oryza sativa subsp. japonica TaxID=39947 RepID=A0A0N7KNC9_ORYSJ|nr:Os07g0440300 [Oryza sativa Japonica Group]